MRAVKAAAAAAVVLTVAAGLTAWRLEASAQSQTPTWSDAELWEQATLRFRPLPGVAIDAQNPLTEAKVALGRTLYFDPRLSKEGNVSCNSCHDLATFGVDNLPTSPGDEGEFGDRNSPTVLNAAFHVAQFWDGRAEDVEEQAGMPILEGVEMGIPSREFLVERLASQTEYPELFARAFPGEEPALTYDNVQKALGAFERTLVTPSRFDDYLSGNGDALSTEEKEGLTHFIQLGCSACHNGVAMGGAGFRKFGIHDAYWEHTRGDASDEGRFGVTGLPEDRYVFKVASLRNVGMTAPYFHDGSVASLEEAVRVMVAAQLGRELSEQELAAVTVFLRSLTGELPASVLEGGGRAVPSS